MNTRVVTKVEKKHDAYIVIANEEVTNKLINSDQNIHLYGYEETRFPVASARHWAYAQRNNPNKRKAFSRTKVEQRYHKNNTEYAHLCYKVADVYSVEETARIAENIRTLLPEYQHTENNDVFAKLKNTVVPYMDNFLYRKLHGHYLKQYFHYEDISKESCFITMKNATKRAFMKFHVDDLTSIEDNKLVSQFKKYVRKYMDGELKKLFVHHHGMTKYQSGILLDIIRSGEHLFSSDMNTLVKVINEARNRTNECATENTIITLRRALVKDYTLLDAYAGYNTSYVDNFFTYASEENLEAYGLNRKSKALFEKHFHNATSTGNEYGLKKIIKAIPEIIADAMKPAEERTENKRMYKTTKFDASAVLTMDDFWLEEC